MSQTPPHPTIWIPGHVPSLKNTKRVACINGQARIYSHPRVKEYMEKTEESYTNKAEKFYNCYYNGTDLAGEDVFNYPVKVGFHFVRENKHKFDFHNAMHIVADMMVKHNWIDDDDMDHFIPVPLYYTPPRKHVPWSFTSPYYSICQSKPGVCIRVIGCGLQK